MKVVDVTEFYSERGGGIRSHLTIRGHFLCQLGHPHVVVAPGSRDEDAVTEQSVAHPDVTTRVVRLAGPSMPYDPTYQLLFRLDKVRARIQTESPDILEAHSPYLASAAALTAGAHAARVRTAFWHSDHLGTYVEPVLTKYLGGEASRALSAPLWQGIRLLLEQFDATFVAGRRQAMRLREAGVTRVIHIPFGVDVETFHPGARDDAERRRWLGATPGDTPLVVAVGRLAFEKRWDVVLEAFAKVRSRRPAALVIFGDGPERAKLEAAAPAGVTFAGFVRDRAALARALASADVLVHGCPVETFGLGVADAVASGLPIVVPDEGGAADSVDPSCSAVYPSLDSSACAAALAAILDRPAEERRAAAWAAAARVPTAAGHFSRVVSAYGELLQEAASRTNKR